VDEMGTPLGHIIWQKSRTSPVFTAEVEKYNIQTLQHL